MIISFTKRLLTNQTSQTNTVDYLCFLYVSSSVKSPLSSQVGNVVLIDSFNVLSRVLSMVLFLRASCCFPAEKKTRSIPPPDAGQPWNCLHILTTSGVRLVDMSVPWQKLGRDVVKNLIIIDKKAFSCLIIKSFENQTQGRQ